MIALVNPKSTTWRFRIPLSILTLGAVLDGRFAYEIVDGNPSRSALEILERMVTEKSIRYVGITVMPGPQLREAVRISHHLKKCAPHVCIIWGGYFATLHADLILKSSYVDFVVRGQGEHAFLQLIELLETCDRRPTADSLRRIHGLSFRVDGQISHNPLGGLVDPNTLPPIPYHKVDIPRYLGRTLLGSRTINYHSSVGCPFLCGFCAVASVYKARWLGLTPARIMDDLKRFQKWYGVDGVEFHDNNFFVSEHRTLEFSELVKGGGIRWWGEARPDTVMRYSDNTWRAMKEGGCKMIFFGAESSSQQVLSLMEKGGTQTPETVLHLAERSRQFNIIPEFSFVLGSPTDSIEENIEQDIRYIRKIKEINPRSEIIIYVYSPVLFEEAEIYRAASSHGFRFPTTLEEWLLPEWQEFDLRKNPLTPWLTENHVKRIRNFERVLNAYYPTVSDLRITRWKRTLLQLLGSWRYHLSFYLAPVEIAFVAQKIFRYRQPEIEGF